MSTLYQLRTEIDVIDAQIIALLAQRFDVVKDIGTYKKAHTIPCLDDARWREVLQSNISQGKQQ